MAKFILILKKNNILNHADYLGKKHLKAIGDCTNFMMYGKNE